MLPVWTPNLMVFLSNACIMILELVAGRMPAPLLGVSLYTPTSVIGVVLAGLLLTMAAVYGDWRRRWRWGAALLAVLAALRAAAPVG